MQELSKYKLTIQRSRFHAHLYKLENLDEISNISKKHRGIHKKANHHCYAAIFTDDSKKQPFEALRNDGEVGQPGKILLNILQKNNLNKHLLIVSRIFGGVKLGIGGVSRAFRETGEKAVSIFLDKKS